MKHIIPALLLFLTASPALADPPGRVGRLSYLENTVSFRAGDEGDWQQAVMNYPITTGDALWTDTASRAELQIGPMEIRIDDMTELHARQIDDDRTLIEMPQGSVHIYLRAVPATPMELSTPSGILSFNTPGNYRIDTDSATGESRIAVLRGSLIVQGARGPSELKAGSGASLFGSPPEITPTDAQPTEFDDWAYMRQNELHPVDAQRYLSQETTGYQDLDRYGSWSDDPNYGAIWYPADTGEDWAPYRSGHWSYVRPWGWTWVDDAPWGFAPFHYGRWVQISQRWAWSPGQRVARPVYAPALVAFISQGQSVALSFGDQRPIGWVPLAPREIFQPYYPTSAVYIKRVNVNYVQANNITISNYDRRVERFANRDAITAVQGDTFRRGKRARDSRVDFDIRKAAVARNVYQIRPEAQPKADDKVVSTMPRPTRSPRDMSRHERNPNEPAQDIEKLWPNDNGRERPRVSDERAPDPEVKRPDVTRPMIVRPETNRERLDSPMIVKPAVITPPVTTPAPRIVRPEPSPRPAPDERHGRSEQWQHPKREDPMAVPAIVMPPAPQAPSAEPRPQSVRADTPPPARLHRMREAAPQPLQPIASPAPSAVPAPPEQPIRTMMGLRGHEERPDAQPRGDDDRGRRNDRDDDRRDGR